MGKIISIIGQQGAIGKTVTAVNLSVALAKKGEKVLLIDADPQGSVTKTFGIENIAGKTLHELLMYKCSMEECVMEEVMDNLSVIPADVELSAIDVELQQNGKDEFLLKERLSKVKDLYDYILVDCPPSFGMASVSALAATDSVIILLPCEIYSLDGIIVMLKTINAVKEKLNSELIIEGILLTLYDPELPHSEETFQKIQEKLHNVLFETVILKDKIISKYGHHDRPLFASAPESPTVKSYEHLADELLEKDSRGIGFKLKARVNRADLSEKTRFALTEVPDIPVKRVLNISIKGEGIDERLHRMFPDAEVIDLPEALWEDLSSIEAESMDVILAVESIVLWDTPEYVFKELNRILVPRGCLVMVFDKFGRNMGPSQDWAGGMGRGKERSYNYCAIRESLRQNQYTSPVKWGEIRGNMIEQKNWQSMLAWKGPLYNDDFEVLIPKANERLSALFREYEG